jgi:hypothetical protein
MKRYVLLLLIFLPGAVALEAKAQDLELTTRVLSLRLCSDGPDVFMIRANLRLRYTNVGKQTLIVPKGNLTTYWRIAPNEDRLLAASWNHFFWVISGNGDMPNLGSKPDSRFCTLKPGASCEIESTDLHLPATKQLPAGNYLLQIVVPVWNGSNEQAYKLREKWKRYGFVWLDAVTSKPMTFTIEDKVKLPACS